MTDPAILRLLRVVLDGPPSPAVSNYDWRRLRAAFPGPLTYATATGAPWPYTAPAHLPARPRDEGPWAPIDYLDI